MYRTERYWGTLGLVAFFGVLAALFGNVVFLFVAGGLLGWLLALQLVFRGVIRAVETGVSVSYTLSQQATQPDHPIDVETTVTVTDPFQCAVTVHPEYPDVAAETPESGVTLPPGDTTATITDQLTFPFAGSYTVGPATVSVESRYSVFTATLDTTPTIDVTVDPQQPDNLHVGQAGERFTVTFGEHGSGNTGPGMVPAGMRAYMPGDPADRIDWKATARLDNVYVREFEIETVRPLLLLVDGRTTESHSNGNRPVEYRRHIAATLAAEAASHGDPVGLYQITPTGVEASTRLSAAPTHYLQLRDRLYTPQQETATTETDHARATPQIPLETATVARRLRDDQSPFGTHLKPFLRGEMEYIDVDGRPLVETVRTYLTRQGTDARVAIIADDQRREELYDAVKLAGQLSPEILVFTTPTALFDSQHLADIDHVYGEYATFEQFRQRLDRIDNVTAFEAAPGDTVQRIVTHHGGGNE